MAGTTTNSATITTGISLSGDDTLTNTTTGVVTNAGIAVYGTGANTPNTVVNAGSIGGTSAGVSLNSGGAVTNQTSGEISGAVGIVLSNYAGSVVNRGLAACRTYAHRRLMLES